jgi:hypothetical protein
MLLGDTVAVYCENSTVHTNTLCGQNTEFFNVKASGTYSYLTALKNGSLVVFRETAELQFSLTSHAKN